MRKLNFCLCENKGADQLRGNREADQRLCFRYADSTVALLVKFEIQDSIAFLWLHRPICVAPGQKLGRPVFSCHGSYIIIKQSSVSLFKLSKGAGSYISAEFNFQLQCNMHFTICAL